MDIHVGAKGLLRWQGGSARCALGRAGVRAVKREGDGVTPAGAWPLRRVLYRADRMATPETRLAVQALTPADGWCDDPADPAYNKPVVMPFAAGHERLWRDDRLYDVIVVLGHNDEPPAAGEGSAIFMHVAREDFGPTEGCVALAIEDLLRLLVACAPGDVLRVAQP
ncbi:MAG: L,D-transpeptidase family protein [Proteobacteria bacterium]|nr:L,D-transpeptidase family protein [Pseudomonadota bacterium]